MPTIEPASSKTIAREEVVPWSSARRRVTARLYV
jgi:hypothetical protein